MRASTGEDHRPTWISGAALKATLAAYLQAYTQSRLVDLAELDRSHTLGQLQALMRAVEELINLATLPDHQARLGPALDLSLDDHAPKLLLALRSQYDPGVAGRFEALLPRLPLLRANLRLYHATNQDELNELRSARDLANYFKARRRHLNTLFYTVSAISIGKLRATDDDIGRLTFTIIDTTLIMLVSGQRKLALADLYADYRCQVVEGGLMEVADHWQELLDENCLEAERLSINELDQTLSPGYSIDRRKLISAPELRHLLLVIQEGYSEFELAQRGFTDLIFCLGELTAFTRDDYFVQVPEDAFDLITARYRHAPWLSELVYQHDPIHPFLGSHSAFVRDEGLCRSDLFLLLRFAYRVRARLLERYKRYQIRSGFLFEDQLKPKLSALGFTILPIKRVQGKEFDVVATKNGVIHNFQCKNAFLDFELMETNLVQFVRNNKRLVRYFERALGKEEAREHLLVSTVGLASIEHYVITRFPVFTDNKRIISERDLHLALR